MLSTNGFGNVLQSEEHDDVKDSRVSKAQKRRDKKAALEKERESRIAEAEIENLSGSRHLESLKLSQMLAERQLQIKQIPSDGHCMYRAIEDQLTDRDGSLSLLELRAQAAEYMRSHADDFLPFLTNPSTGDMYTPGQTLIRVECGHINHNIKGIHKLRKLRVIDVAGNQLKMFPATFNELLLDELYCEDNPFLQKKLVPSIQDEEILSLKEITARYILKELRVRLSEVRVAITHYPEVRIMLSEASMCALCGQGFLNIWLECVKFVNIRKEMKITSKINTIPVRALLCSYKCFNQQCHDYYGVAVP
ncbi:UNVERIFIED_CONTAM: hypothetical protein FKN15_029173 [Acipenser sinensis]